MAKSDKLDTQITKDSIKPLAGYILVEPIPAETRTASGIILPETSQERPAIGTVIAVGGSLILDGKEIVAPVKVGDKVFYRRSLKASLEDESSSSAYKKWGGDEIKVAGEDLKLVGFADIMALVK